VASVDPTEARNINVKVVIHVRPRVSQLVRMLTGRGPEPGEQAAGIAPASLISQVVLQEGACVERGCQWLQYVCTDAGLAELVPSWHRMTPEVRAAIMRLVRGES
jgi:hypothetical protein